MGKVQKEMCNQKWGGPSALSYEPTFLTEIKQGLSHHPQDGAGLHSSCTTRSKVTSAVCAVRSDFRGTEWSHEMHTVKGVLGTTSRGILHILALSLRCHIRQHITSG